MIVVDRSFTLGRVPGVVRRINVNDVDESRMRHEKMTQRVKVVSSTMRFA